MQLHHFPFPSSELSMGSYQLLKPFSQSNNGGALVVLSEGEQAQAKNSLGVWGRISTKPIFRQWAKPTPGTFDLSRLLSTFVITVPLLMGMPVTCP